MQQTIVQILTRWLMISLHSHSTQAATINPVNLQLVSVFCIWVFTPLGLILTLTNWTRHLWHTWLWYECTVVKNRSDPNNFLFNFNSDHPCKNHSIWPIQRHSNELPPKNQFQTVLAGLSFGAQKPVMHIFIKYYVDQAKDLVCKGVTHREKTKNAWLVKFGGYVIVWIQKPDQPYRT